MSDIQQLTHISKGEVEAFFADKSSDFSCPICNEKAFSAILKPDETNAAEFHVPIVNPSGYLPSVGLACENCGYIILFYFGTVLKWTAERKGPKSE
jgi:hypothetical protein